MINLNIVLIILMNISLYYSLTYLLMIYQQEHYDYSKLIKSLKMYYLTKPYIYLTLISLFIYLFIDSLLVLILLIISYFILVVYQPKYIIKLKYTNRICRIIITMLIIIYMILFLTKFSLVMFAIINLIIPIFVYIASLLNYPIEIIKKNKYIKRAKTKLNNNPKLLKIAITGSYGKTTTKHILNELLKDEIVTLVTPQSYNTILGLCKTINDSLTNQTEILIVEMGTNHLGEIKEMCKLINPHIGVITEIGPQHLSTLKTIDNVLKAKLEIAEEMSYDDILILNGDNLYLEKIKLLNINNIYRVGKKINNLYHIDKLKVNGLTQSFDIYKENKKQIEITTELLGEHNVNNILLAYAVIDQIRQVIDISNYDFARKIKQILPFNHRLSYKKVNNIHIFDDSYNSNINGFKNAIKVLNSQTTKKIIITPGIVDNGNDEKRLNEEIALTLINSFDEIYLIKNSVIKYYQTVLDQAKKPYLLFNSFKEAYIYLICNHHVEEVSVLFENDLPDSYLER